MTNLDLQECLEAIQSRWPEWECTDAITADLRAGLHRFEKENALLAIRQVRLDSNFKSPPIGKLVSACKKLQPMSDRRSSEVSRKWPIFVYEADTGNFHQLTTPANYDEDRATSAAHGLRDNLGEGWIVMKDCTVHDMVRQRGVVWAAKKDEIVDVESLDKEEPF